MSEWPTSESEALLEEARLNPRRKKSLPTFAEGQAALVEKQRKLREARALEPEAIERDARVSRDEAIASKSMSALEAWSWYGAITGKSPDQLWPKQDTAERMTEDTALVNEALQEFIRNPPPIQYGPTSKIIQIGFPIGSKVTFEGYTWEIADEPIQQITRMSSCGRYKIGDRVRVSLLKPAPETP